MRRLNPNKLLLSKWTAAHPRHKEKHFMVTEVFRDEEGTVLDIELQAILTGRAERLPWQTLKNPVDWQIGWK